MPAHPPGLGIIGCEGYAYQLIQRLWSLPNCATLVAATSLTPDSPEARACRGRGVPVFGSVDELLAFAPGRAMAIINATPIHVHRPLTIRCLEAGFPVWLEKPPVATLDELDELLAVSASTGQPVSVGFNSLYGSEVQRLKAELVAGKYGRVRRVRSIGAWHRTDAYYARSTWAGRLRIGHCWIYDGTINNPFAHLLCNGLYFAARKHHSLAEPASVEARLWHGHDVESEDTSSLRIVTTDGVEILSHFTLCPEEEIVPSTVIDCDGATITLHDFHTVDIKWSAGPREVRESVRENRLEMLETLTRQLSDATETPRCPLALTRPFTQVVNLAFKQVLASNGGTIPAVPPEFIERFPHEKSTGTRIHGINASLLAAHGRGELLALPTKRSAATSSVTPVPVVMRRSR